MKTFLTLAFLLAGYISQGQVGIGEWREHLPYTRGIAVCKAGNRIYCSTSPSLFYYDTEDNSISKISKAHGLSDLEINTLKYSEKHNTVVIGYNNGNIDLIVNNEIINVPDIKRSFIQADKSINEILIDDDLAYLSTGFGIIVIDLIKKEISETFNPGAAGVFIHVNESCIRNDTIYAACEDGIYYGSLKNNLIDFQNWVKMSGLPEGNFNTIVATSNKLVCNFQLEGQWQKDTIYSFDSGAWQATAFGTNYLNDNIFDLNVFDNKIVGCSSGSMRIVDENLTEIYRIHNYGDNFSAPSPREAIIDGNDYWIADTRLALVHQYNGSINEAIVPTGPIYSDSFGMDYSNGHLWTTCGSLNIEMKNTYNNKGIANFSDETWTSYAGGTVFDSLRDIHAIAIHPDNPNHVFAASYYGGVLEFKDGERINIFNESNSDIQSLSTWAFRPIGGLAFDKSKILWITNSGLVDNPLVAYDLNGNWYAYPLGNIQANGTSYLRKIIIDKNENKWMVSYLKGIIVFNENGTLDNKDDDQVILLTNGETSGNLPNTEVLAIAEDLDGKIWIGTSSGLSVINNPEKVFDSEGVAAERVIIEEDGNANYLLSDEIITSIKIDAGNRKWIGTHNSGAYLMTSDMQTELFHFTTLNSPLISDAIFDIEINDESGEVFMSTDKGLVSFMGTATTGDNYDGPIYAYPNPVPPNFTGTIGIRGVVSNAEIKITDITGNLVFETMAQGTTATWDGKSLNGKKVQSGVYIVHISNSDGSETKLTKILFLN